MKDVESVLSSFCCNPKLYWEGNVRQLNKSIIRMENLSGHYECSFSTLSKIIVGIAKWRIKNRVPTIYLPSFGSSGSHLLQHIFSTSFDVIGLNEVYLAPGIENILRRSSDDFRKLLLESYHLLHSNPNKVFSGNAIVNTAHKANLNIFSYSTASFQAGLILRNPCDVVLSRTFRKEEYREYLGKSSTSDKEYLKLNIEKAKVFYRRALDYPYDQYFFYEGIVSCSDDTVSAIANFMASPDAKELVKNSLIKAIEEGATNKFEGVRPEIPLEYREMAKAELKETCEMILRSTGKSYC